MKRFVDAIKRALENENWYCALALTLVLPDICAKMQYPDEGSQKRYIRWFNDYLLGKYTMEIGSDRKRKIFLSGEDCYALRCSLIHEGVECISHQRCRQVLDRYLFITDGPHCNFVDIRGRSYLQLSVRKFCDEFCSAVEKWNDNVSDDGDIQERISQLITIHKPGVERDGIRWG